VGWSPAVPGLLATASDDFSVKLWGRPATTAVRVRHLDCGVYAPLNHDPSSQGEQERNRILYKDDGFHETSQAKKKKKNGKVK
jgi:hypothetical protein